MSSLRRISLICGSLVACVAMLAGPAKAQDAGHASVEKLKESIATESPKTKVDKVDSERLVVRRIDVVDDQGVIRMTLASPAPLPIVDGIQYKRSIPASGLTIYDKNGNERGGYGVADIEGSAVVAAQDHVNGDAIGWRIMPDGSITFVMNERAPIRREAALGNRIVPGPGGSTRIRMSVAADGTPAIALADKQDRPRLRLTVNEQGFGAIEFLDADGKIVESIAPEAGKTSAKRSQR